MNTVLNLTGVQQQQISAILTNKLVKEFASDRDQTVPADQRQNTHRGYIKESRAAILAVLTPEQAKLFQSWRWTGN